MIQGAAIGLGALFMECNQAQSPAVSVLSGDDALTLCRRASSATASTSC